MQNFNFDNFNVEEASQAEDVFHDATENGVSHDDGAMFVSFNGERYTYYLGQDISNNEYNRQANQVLRSLGVVGRVSGRNN